MSWIDFNEPIGILMPESDPALALPSAISIAKSFPRHRVFVSEAARPYINVYIKGDESLSHRIAIDLSQPPETRMMPKGLAMGITANPMNSSFNVILKTLSDDPLRARDGILACLGIAPAENEWRIPDAMVRAERYLERSGYYKGRMRVFLDSKDPKMEQALREIYGTEVMFLGHSPAPPDETLMLLAMSDFYVGARTILTGFAFLFGKKCILTESRRVPEGVDARPVGNLRRTLNRMGFL
ncbi:MAG: hypothetical protein ACP5QG_00745 [candidate division WOR-3 bacterium]